MLIISLLFICVIKHSAEFRAVDPALVFILFCLASVSNLIWNTEDQQHVAGFSNRNESNQDQFFQ